MNHKDRDGKIVGEYSKIRKELPSLTCVYFVYSGDELVYIGKAKNLKQRFSSHHHALDFELPSLSIQWQIMSEEDAIKYEEQYINELNPRLNHHVNHPIQNGHYRVNIYLDDQDFRAIEIIRKRYGQESSSAAIRFALRVFALDDGAIADAESKATKKHLPRGIQEALNSGEGSYKP